MKSPDIDELREVSADGAVRLAFELDGPMARWLRVNAQLLDLRDATFREDLSDAELHILASRSAKAVVPVTLNSELSGLLLLCDDSADWKPRGSPALWREAIRRTGWRWDKLKSRLRVEVAARIDLQAQQLRAAGTLASSIAHEVRNPLAAIKSIVQLLDEDPSAAPGDMLHSLLPEIDRIDQQISGLLQLARPGTQAQTEVDLSAIALETAQFISAHARRSQLSIHAKCDCPLLVYASGRELRQVLLNLLLNACETSPPRSEIHVNSRLGDIHGLPGAVVEVIDKGAGIPPEDLLRVFEPFYTTKSSGTGLGLAVCRDLVTRNGGEISISSVLGTGTTLSIQIPLSSPKWPQS